MKCLFSAYTCITMFNQQNNYRQEKSYPFTDEETNSEDFGNLSELQD